jgi:hypothetical protein
VENRCAKSPKRVMMGSVKTLGRDSGAANATGHISGQAAPAVRASRPGWRDPRLWIGLLIVAASIVAGARLFDAADDSVQVWAVTGPMAAGEEITSEDLEPVRLRFVDGEDADRYFGADEELPAGARLTRELGAGELLPRSALSSDDTGLATTAITIDALHVPPGLAPGDRIVLLAGEGKEPLLDDAVVVDVPQVETDFGSAAEQAIVIGVPRDRAAELNPVITADQAETLAIIVQG